MSYCIAFQDTGDTIAFEPVNGEVLEFYVDQLDQQDLNSFSAVDKHAGQKMMARLQEFHDSILAINQWLPDLADMRLDHCEAIQYLEQKILNRMHADWANSQSRCYDIQAKRKQFGYSGVAEQIHDMYPDDEQLPPLSAVLHKLNLLDSYNATNPRIHGIESMFNQLHFTVSDSFVKICDNPFGKHHLTNDIANVTISFNHVGRTLYNKYMFFDHDLECDDENSYNELLGYVTLGLLPPQTIPLSREYVQWCQSHSLVPSGDRLNVGVIPNLYEKLFEYRKIILRNLLQNSRFTIQNTRG